MTPADVDKAGKRLTKLLTATPERDPLENEIKRLTLTLILGIARNLAVLAERR